MKKLKRLISYVLITCLAGILGIFLISPASYANPPLVCNMSTVTGDDDGSFQMLLPFSLKLGSTEYDRVYYSTNATVTFGQPDGTFHDYPQTPSVSVAGRDWVSFGPGAYTSYGYNNDSFCIEWSVRPFPQSSGPLTQMRLVVNKFPNGNWHGEITTMTPLPPDARRAIRYEYGQPVVTMAAAFDVGDAGIPIEVSPAPTPSNFTEPPLVPTQCWDGSTVYAPNTCPTEPTYTCWDGTITNYESECPASPPDIICWDSSTVPWNSTCPPEPPAVQCWDGTSVPWNGICPIEPQVTCWDGSIVHYESECTPTPPDIVCWNEEVISWNETCPQMPPPIECWDGSEVNWDAQCPPIPPNINCWDGSIISWNEVCPIEPSPTPSLTASPEPQPSESQTPTLEPSPQPTEPSPQPSETSVQPSETPSPSPTPSLSPSESPLQPEEPVVVPSPTPEPETSSPEPLVPDSTESPTPDPSPETTDLPSNNNIIDGLTLEESVALNELLTEYGPMDAISFEDFEASGLDYEDLPPDQPVMLDNGVILTAEVADAIEMFENPSELLLTVLTDPGKALKAFANVGADMTPEQRKESQTVVVASIIVGQVISTTNLITGRIR